MAWCKKILELNLTKKNVSFSFQKKKFGNLIMASTSLLMFSEETTKDYKNIYKRLRSVFGTDCYAYGLLISRKIDLIIEANMKPWDYMAQAFLINELGGVISDWRGQELNLNSNGKVVASYDVKHHKTILGLINDIS